MTHATDLEINDTVLDHIVGGVNHNFELMMASFSNNNERAFNALVGIVDQYRRTCDAHGTPKTAQGAMDALKQTFATMDYAVTPDLANQYLSWSSGYNGGKGFLELAGITL